MTGGRGAIFVLAGLSGLLVVMAVISGWQGTTRLTQQRDDMAAVEDACRSFVEAYGTFDFRDPGGYRNRLMSLTTGTLKAAVVSSQIDSLALGQLRTIATEVGGVEVSALSEDEATASATAEQQRRSTDPVSGQLVDEAVIQHVACRVVLAGGSWLVAEFRLQSEEAAGRTPVG
jgi:hypothetical protein